LEQLEPESSVYNICRASRLLGDLNAAALDASLNEIISRHETLRTAFRLVDGRPVQVVQPIQNISIEYVDLRAMPDDERDVEIQRRIKAESPCRFDLSAGLLLRSRLLRAGDQEHVLTLMTHHSASDAWSMGILTHELWTLYKAFSNGKPSPLELLPVQYSDYAVWQRNWLQGDVLDGQLSYWKEKLNDLPILNLPTDRPRAPRQSFNGARVSIALPQALTASLNELSNRIAVTPFMTLLAAFQLLLYRYTGQEDIVVGSPIANRRRPEIEGLIGFFVNTLVMRADLSGNPSFRELLSRVKDTCVAADANQDLPFEKLVQDLQPERDLSRNPLFQVMFVLQNTTSPFSGIPGLRVEPIELEATRSPFDLSLFLRERGEKYIGYIEYNTDLFNRDRIERMVGHFQTLLEAIVADPDQSIATLSILTEAERHQILVEWNDTAADYPKDKCIHELFEAQVERTPDAIALEFEDNQVTYRELNRKANQLAHHLVSLGIGPEKLVGICVERSVEMVVGLLGILKAGGAYLPLDSAYPKERLRFMVEDAQVSAIVTQEKLLDRTQDSAPSTQYSLLCLDRDQNAVEKENTENPKRNVSSENLAYVIYTSGSAGQPKGVAIEHRNTFALLNWARSVFTFDELTGVLASTSICFDLSVFELFVPISWGGKIILVENALSLRASDANGITLVNTVPSAMTALLAAGALPDSARVVNLAGEPLRPELVNQLYQTGKVEKVYDLYGPSETTTYSTFSRRAVNGPATIGRPISNTQIYLLDSNLQPVPVGVPGETYIAGAGVARGYLNRPELTAEKFTTDPFSSDSNSRLYRTGDLARYLPNGDIEFLGRIDNQVKIRGYRIELGEIEAALNLHPVVKESVVVTYQWDGSSETQLVSYVVQDKASTSDINELSSYLTTKLPAFMIPPVIVSMEVLPLTPNGKIDRAKLPTPEKLRSELNIAPIGPRSELEELVANNWREILQIDNISVHDNFFTLGGHSLLAIQVVSRLQEAFNKEVPLRILFDAPTITELTLVCEKLLRDGQAPSLPPIVPVPRDGPFPLSMNQEHLWRLDQIIPGTHFFNIPYIFRLSGNLNVGALEQALREVVRRHEALRTVFDVVCGQPMQVVYEVTNVHLTCHDLRSMETDLISGRAAALILEEREYPFQLATGPLFRVTLVRLTETESLLLITIHHIVSDHWSMQIFSRELALIYEHIVRGKPLAFTKPALQFADYVHWERRMLATGSLDKILGFWRRQLAPPLHNLEFQIDSGASTSVNLLTSRRSFEVNEHLVAAIKAFANDEKCTTSMVLLAALNILLFSQTGHTDIRVGLLMANRGDPQTTGTIGHFMNTVIVRTQLSPDMTCHQLLYRVRASVLAAHAHQQLPFEYLANALEEQDRINRASLFQVLVMYRFSTAPGYEVSGLHFAPIVITQPDTDSEVMMTTHDLVLDVRETSTKLTGSVNCGFTSGCEIINSLAERLAIILRQMISGEFDNKIGMVADLQLRNTG
jgi:amino acid adenylation domain-containing protein